MSPVSDAPHIDTHAHLDGDSMGRVEDVLERAEKAGVKYVISPATSIESCRNVSGLPDRFAGVFTAAGIHAHDAKDFHPDSLEEIEEHLRHPGNVAVGEVGLDFHYDFSPRDVQVKTLENFLGLAEKTGKPLILHCREAEEELYRMLLPRRGKLSGVIHCFTGSTRWAQAFAELGFFIGFTGIITFGKSDEIRRVVEALPLEQILAETDSPYMAPVPFRGKVNEPSYLPVVAEKIASLKGKTLEETRTALLNNARRCFRLPI
jgi:TatD DNase family protein